MDQFFANLAPPMIGFALLYFVLNKNFENQKIVNKNNLDSQLQLIQKIDKLADNIHELVVADAQKNIVLINTADEIREMYSKISLKQENIKKTVEAVDIRTQLCPKGEAKNV